MSLEKEIAKWDGKSADDIRKIYDSYCDNTRFTNQLITYMERLPLQKGATWLFKRHLESGSKLGKDKISSVYFLLTKFESWEAKLHILQSIPYMPIGKKQKTHVEDFLRVCLTDKNKFVRAWTYNGFYELARQYPEFQEEVSQFLEMAMRDEAASVKARIRNILKTGF